MSKARRSQTPAHTAGLQVEMRMDILRAIRQHAKSMPSLEVCGVLIGDGDTDRVQADAMIEGVHSEQGGAHVTFTQATWEHIFAIKDRKYPDRRVVGWYHSHPGFGVFLSEHDTFIHQHFFSAPHQIAWVYDPQSEEEGCFGWKSGRIERLGAITLRDEKAGELAGAEPEPVAAHVAKASEPAQGEKPADWKRITGLSLLCVTCFLAGFLLCLLFQPVLVLDRSAVEAPQGSAGGARR